MRTALAIGAARLSGALSRLRGGGATSLPGVVGLKIQPKLISRLRGELAGSIVVTGTNGKTTTSRFVGEILDAAGKPYVHNQSGSNLLRGIAAVLARGTGVAKQAGGGRSGAARKHRDRKPWGLFEVDEATMPAACAELRPDVVVVTNLFRDQLDRYGELQRTADYLRKAFAALPKNATILLNADDPLVASLGEGLPQKVVYFGIEDTSVSKPGLPHAADSITAPNGALLRYDAVFTGHLGHYHGPGRGGLRRPKPSVAATDVTLDGTEGSAVKIRFGSALSRGGAARSGGGRGRKTVAFRIGVPGLYNVYNAVAAAAAGRALGASADKIAAAISQTAAAFGRAERTAVDGRTVFIGLIKNPIGANEVIHMLRLDRQPKDFLIVINDNFADGTDVSWLWDADFEQLLPMVRTLAVAGTRADDMALRLKYAGRPEEDVVVHRSLEKALGESLAAVPDGGTLYVLPTYTAMLELRRELAGAGHLAHYLREDS